MVHREKGATHDNQLRKSTVRQQRHFTEETLASLAELGAVLEKIHRRLISEGYQIKDGIIHRDETGSSKRKGTPR